MAPRGRKNDIWLKRVLVPFRTFRLLFITILLGLQAWAAAVMLREKDKTSREDEIIIVWLVLILICLLLDITAIIMFARHNLSPRTFLVFNVIQTAICLAGFIQFAISAIRIRNSTGLVLQLLLLLSFVGPLIYAAVIVHRTRRGGAYTRTPNPANLISQSHQTSGITIYNNDDINTSYRSHSASIELPESTHHTRSASEYYGTLQPGQQQQTYYSPQDIRQTPQTPVSAYGGYSQPQQPHTHAPSYAPPPQHQQVQEKENARTHVAEMPVP